MSFSWQNSPSNAFGNLADDYADHIHTLTRDICERFAPQIESWMKENAVWTDRTSNARQSLWADVDAVAGLIIVIMSHGVEYGEYLEWAHGSQYAIIAPAIDHFTPLIWRAIRAALGT